MIAFAGPTKLGLQKATARGVFQSGGCTACVAVLDFLGCLKPVAANCGIDGLSKRFHLRA